MNQGYQIVELFCILSCSLASDFSCNIVCMILGYASAIEKVGVCHAFPGMFLEETKTWKNNLNNTLRSLGGLTQRRMYSTVEGILSTFSVEQVSPNYGPPAFAELEVPQCIVEL